MWKLGFKRAHGASRETSSSSWALEGNSERFRSCWWHMWAMSVMLGKNCRAASARFYKIWMESPAAAIRLCCPPVVNLAFPQSNGVVLEGTGGAGALSPKYTTRQGFYFLMVTSTPWLVWISVFVSHNLGTIQTCLLCFVWPEADRSTKSQYWYSHCSVKAQIVLLLLWKCTSLSCPGFINLV